MSDILPIIPQHSNRKAPEYLDYRRYRDRNRIASMFGFLKDQRHIVTRFEKAALSYPILTDPPLDLSGLSLSGERPRPHAPGLPPRLASTLLGRILRTGIACDAHWNVRFLADF